MGGPSPQQWVTSRPALRGPREEQAVSRCLSCNFTCLHQTLALVHPIPHCRWHQKTVPDRSGQGAVFPSCCLSLPGCALNSSSTNL